ncbi:PAS domain-containing sensor histidine kinase [Actinomycetaceae bacterium L2_0104]
MPTLTNILARCSSLSPADREWLHQLVGDWQTIADVATADLLLIIPRDGGGFTVAAHCRPATAATLFDDDMVSKSVVSQVSELASEVMKDGMQREIDVEGRYSTLRPVRTNGRIIAVLDVVTAYEPDVVPSQVHENYEQIAGTLAHMVTTGEFPFENTPTGVRHGTPRLTDGFVQIDEDGTILYASPNAVSNFHRLGVQGTLRGHILAELVTDAIEDHSRVEESLAVVVMGRAPWLTELETHGVILSMRAVPLRDRGERLGAIILCRDITELRHREQELLTKDATIREINHRVKNNLQTVSALLRMQARRAEDEVTRLSLETAQRRVATIALVHQTLSQTIKERVNFNEVFGPLLRMSSDIATTGATVTSNISGEFGEIGANQTTALAVVLNELVTNAVEHGVPQGGHIEVTAKREGNHLTVDIADDGVGMGGKRPGAGLGTQIVQTMVEGELHGSIEWLSTDRGGTCVRLEMEVDA